MSGADDAAHVSLAVEKTKGDEERYCAKTLKRNRARASVRFALTRQRGTHGVTEICAKTDQVS